MGRETNSCSQAIPAGSPKTDLNTYAAMGGKPLIPDNLLKAVMQSSLLPELRAALKSVADPAKAPLMRAYMKSKLPYLGIQAPLLRRTCKLFFAAHPLDSPAAWRDAVLEIWRSAKFREERYAAIELTGAKRYAAFQTPASLPMYEELVVTGAWWDYVDVIASHRLGPLLRRYPTSIRRKMLSWSRSESLWKRRSAILCHVLSPLTKREALKNALASGLITRIP